MTAALKPDVILLDLHMPDDRSFSPEFVKANFSGARVLAMSLSSDYESEEDIKLLAESFVGDDDIPAKRIAAARLVNVVAQQFCGGAVKQFRNDRGPHDDDDRLLVDDRTPVINTIQLEDVVSVFWIGQCLA